jgi:uncharacterized protein YgiM (DUF1202 family)
VRCSIKSFTCIPFLVLAVIVCASSDTAFATATDEGSVQARVVGTAPDTLNIREHPTSQSKLVGIIPPDSHDVTIFGEAVVGWKLVKYGQIEGWVATKFIVPEGAGWVGRTDAPSATGQQIGRCIVSDPTGTNLNVRATPQGSITGTIGTGALVRVVDTGRDYKGQPWAYIVGWEGGEQIGWVFREFVSCY